jgi:diadenosine tetraphosphate (Ap4A) HIT family hydrolase
VTRCYICDKNDEVGELLSWERVHVSSHWRLALAFDASLPGWLVLVPRRHVEGLDALTRAEAAEMGLLLRDASAALVEVTGCQRTYIMLFAEAEGFAHLHMHIVPRQADLPVAHWGPGVFAYLGAPPDQRIPAQARDLLASARRWTDRR